MEETSIKQESDQLTKSCRIFSALNLFLILTIFILVFGNLIGINLPKYYPVIREWSIGPLEGPSMGFFGAVGFAVLLALPLALIFYFFAPNLQKYLEIRFKTFKNLSTAFFIFGIFYFVVKEWREWGIDKMGLADNGFLNAEMIFLTVVLGLFLIFLSLSLILEKKIFE